MNTLKNTVFLCILGYFALSMFQIFVQKKTEYFPVYSFKLYSKIPQKIEMTDLKIWSAASEEHLMLLSGELPLTKIERKFWRTRLNFNPAPLNESEREDLEALVLKATRLKPPLEFSTEQVKHPKY